jgi:hypothetical protein
MVAYAEKLIQKNILLLKRLRSMTKVIKKTIILHLFSAENEVQGSEISSTILCLTDSLHQYCHIFRKKWCGFFRGHTLQVRRLMMR